MIAFLLLLAIAQLVFSLKLYVDNELAQGKLRTLGWDLSSAQELLNETILLEQEDRLLSGASSRRLDKHADSLADVMQGLSESRDSLAESAGRINILNQAMVRASKETGELLVNIESNKEDRNAALMALEARLVLRLNAVDLAISRLQRAGALEVGSGMTDDEFFEMSAKSAEIQRVARNAVQTFLEKEFATGGRSLAVVTTKVQQALEPKVLKQPEPISDEDFIKKYGLSVQARKSKRASKRMR